MARILVVGSRKSFDPAKFRGACSAIGRAIAERKHTVVAAGCGIDDAETWLLDGANAAADGNNKTSLIPFAPALPNTQDLIQTSSLAGRWPNLSFQPPFRTKGSWAVGQAVALIRSDAALLIGGGPLTANVGSLALELGKPYYAVAELGGAAKALADEDYAKHRAMGMREDLIAPSLGDSAFGSKVIEAIEFLIHRRKERASVRKSAVILAVSLVILVLFLGLIFRHDPFGSEPRLVYTTCAGALVGVLLAFLVGRVVDQKSISVAQILGQIALASFLGVLYGIVVLEAGDFYKANISGMSTADADSLGIKMALLGVGVGALLGPASRRALEDLGRSSKLNVE